MNLAAIFGVSHVSYFNELLPQDSSDQLQNRHVPTRHHCDQKFLKVLVDSERGIGFLAAKFDVHLMSRHEKRDCYNFGINSPISTKLHRILNSPALKTSTCRNCEICIAPPAGDRKSDVLDFEVQL